MRPRPAAPSRSESSPGAPNPTPTARTGELHVDVRRRHAGSRSGNSTFDLDATFVAATGVTVVVGPSGAGKTTLLRCIAGLTDPQEGRITVGGRVLFDARHGVNLEAARRRVAFVFQDLALFPHLSVQDNVMYGLRRMDSTERERRTLEILESFQISHLRHRSPHEISGGEQQRVALARSLVTEPSALLLDEPLSSLDPGTKVRIVDDLQRWNETSRIPILYVTHDHGEVLALGDRVVALDQGRIVAEGLPLDMATPPPRLGPAQPADFENLFDATVLERRQHDGTMVCRLTGTSLLLVAPMAQAPVGAEVRLGVRAADILVSSSPPAMLNECNVLRGRMARLERDGAVIEARVDCGADVRVRLAADAADAVGLQPAADVWLMIGIQSCQLVRPVDLDVVRRLLVFVCHGNTVRSPMAQAICNAELAVRLDVPSESLDRLGLIKAMSAGLTARPGASLAADVEHALRELGVPVTDHSAHNLTHRVAEKAEAIFCMTEAQRNQLVAAFPAAESKSFRLVPHADISDPHGSSPEGFVDCARLIQDHVRHRLDALGISGPT